MATMRIDQKAIARLIRITETQLSNWHAELNNASLRSVSPSVALNYWFILSGIYNAQVAGAELEKAAAYSLIPNARENTGRKYLSLCAADGLVITIQHQRKRYVRLADPAKAALEKNGREWMMAFGKLYEEVTKPKKQ